MAGSGGVAGTGGTAGSGATSNLDGNYARVAPEEEMIDLSIDDVSQRAPRGHALVTLAAGRDRDDALALAADLGGELVGQIPSLRLYQLLLSTTNRAELDAALLTADADPRVEAAGYDLELKDFQAVPECPPASDLLETPEPHDCHFEITGLKNALTIWTKLRPDLSVSPVQVGVVDSGLTLPHAELSAGNFIGLDPALVVDPNPATSHGTQVTGVVAALDDNGQSTGGIAQRFLGEELVVRFAPKGTTNAPALVAAMDVLVAGAEVVNLSFGTEEIKQTPTMSTAQYQHYYKDIVDWRQLIAAWPDRLFVAAAPNKAFALDGDNQAPGGLQLPNLITVGGNEVCEPEAVDATSAYGLVDLAAPGEFYPRIDPQDQTGGGVLLNASSGNSVAAPQVTSLAAILKSLDSGATPAELKAAILDGAAPGPQLMNGRMLHHGNTLGQFLLDKAPLSAPNRELLDAPDPSSMTSDDIFDGAGVAVGRICGRIQYSGMGLPNHSYLHDEDLATGFVNDQGFSFVVDGMDSFLSVSCTDCTLNTIEYAIAEPPAQTDVVTASYTNKTVAPNGVGAVVSGTLEVTSCEIVERFPVLDTPSIVLVSGSFTMGMDYVEPPGSPEPRALNGDFILPFAVFGGAALNANLETLCGSP